MSTESKLSILDVMSKYRKEHGEGSISILSEGRVSSIETTSTGCLSLDMLIGGVTPKGFPKGRIVELYGPEASMKTTTGLYAIRENQKETNKVSVILDIEQAFDLELAIKIGVDPSKLIFAQPETTEEAFQLAEELISTGDIGIILIDSVAAMVPKAELEGDYGDSKMGVQARLMSQALRKIKGVIRKTDTCAIFINQVRDKIGVMYGNPETTTSGNALKFYTSLRLRCSSNTLKDKEELGREVTFKLIKSKISASAVGKSVKVPYFYDSGFNKYNELANLALVQGLITRKGAWYYDSEDETKLGQGIDSVVAILKDNQEYFDVIFNKIFKVEQNVEVQEQD